MAMYFKSDGSESKKRADTELNSRKQIMAF